MAVACALVSISILIVSNASAYSTVLLFGALYGAGVGAPLTINPLLTSGTLGMKNFGAIFGILNLIAIVGSGIGPVWAGIAFDREGSYASVLYVFAALMLLTAGIAFRINTTSRRSWETAEAQPADAVD
jgi:MFS family permease